MTKNGESRLTQRFRKYLRERSMRCSVERLAVLAFAEASAGSFSCADVLVALEKQGLRLSQATVYNTMGLLTSFGAVFKQTVGPGGAVYALVGDNQPIKAYSVCRKCGAVVAREIPEVVSILQHVGFRAFDIDAFTITAAGICSKCRRAKKPKKTESKKQ